MSQLYSPSALLLLCMAHIRMHFEEVCDKSPSIRKTFILPKLLVGSMEEIDQAAHSRVCQADAVVLVENSCPPWVEQVAGIPSTNCARHSCPGRHGDIRPPLIALLPHHKLLPHRHPGSDILCCAHDQYTTPFSSAQGTQRLTCAFLSFTRVTDGPHGFSSHSLVC